MKRNKILIAAFALAAIGFTSCKKDYTCTCTTTVGGVSTTSTYDLKNQNRVDANDACERYESDNTFSTTTCHL